MFQSEVASGGVGRALVERGEPFEVLAVVVVGRADHDLAEAVAVGVAGGRDGRASLEASGVIVSSATGVAITYAAVAPRP